MSKGVAPDAISLSRWLKGRSWPQALLLFQKTQQSRVQPDLVAVNSLLAALRPAWAWALCILGGAARWLRGLDLLRFSQQRRLQADLVAVNSLLISSCKGQEWERSLELAAEMHRANLGADCYTQDATLMAATRGQRWTLALQLSSFASLTSLVSYNAALNALSKSLKWSNTLALLMFAEATRMVLDYQALCVGLGAMSFRWRRALSIVRRSGQAESFLPVVVQALAAASESAQAIKLLRSARQSPGLVTFNAALRACKEANEALALLDDAQQASLQPTCVSLIAACSNTHGWHSRQVLSRLQQYLGHECQEDVNALVSAADLLQESQALTAPCQGVCQSLASAPAVKRLIAILHQGVPPGRFKDPILERQQSLGVATQHALQELRFRSRGGCWVPQAQRALRTACGAAAKLKASAQLAWTQAGAFAADVTWSKWEGVKGRRIGSLGFLKGAQQQL
ncbi:unnamed protein product [Effrenium voratum]|uniref:Pentatricopeptide repeat-containing protein MRL1, chloroplastic n=1 Tax=Effrenium voratum TaxID=2562239 RepID=A0AA36HRI0_9DINO|nr:unnamed protein product [Effrenium voratum]